MRVDLVEEVCREYRDLLVALEALDLLGVMEVVPLRNLSYQQVAALSCDRDLGMIFVLNKAPGKRHRSHLDLHHSSHSGCRRLGCSLDHQRIDRARNLRIRSDAHSRRIRPASSPAGMYYCNVVVVEEGLCDPAAH